MGLTLAEAAKQVKDPLQSGVIEMFAKASDFLLALPFQTIPGGSVKYNREGSLPSVAFRGVNESFTQSVGILNPVTDSTYIVGGDFDVDRYILETMGGEQRGVQTNLKIKAAADAWSLKFIKGDNVSDPREFDGLQVRVVGSQLIANGASANGDPLSIAKLDELIDAVDNPTHLLMSKALRRRLTAAARTTTVGGYITYDKDAFGRTVTKYNDLPILVTQNGATEPLGFTESNPGGGTATGTSIYCVSFGDGKLSGIQNGTLSARDLGELQAGVPAFRTRVEWYAGIAVWHGRAVGRLWGISNAAAVV